MTVDARKTKSDLLARRLATVIFADTSSKRGKISQQYDLYCKLQKAAKQCIGDLRKRLSV